LLNLSGVNQIFGTFEEDIVMDSDSLGFFEISAPSSTVSVNGSFNARSINVVFVFIGIGKGKQGGFHVETCVGAFSSHSFESNSFKDSDSSPFECLCFIINVEVLVEGSKESSSEV